MATNNEILSLLNCIHTALAEIVFHNGLILSATRAHRIWSRFDGGSESIAFLNLQLANNEELGRELMILEEVEAGIISRHSEGDAGLVVLFVSLLYSR